MGDYVGRSYTGKVPVWGGGRTCLKPSRTRVNTMVQPIGETRDRSYKNKLYKDHTVGEVMKVLGGCVQQQETKVHRIEVGRMKTTLQETQ